MQTTTREHPILFRPELVRKILDGKKTQTRRPVKPQSLFDGKDEIVRKHPQQAGCPFGQVGDVLWVRETFAFCIDNVGTSMVTYRATPTHGRAVLCDNDGEGDYVGTRHHDNVPACTGPWRPSIHMPRWACRLRLEITEVRVERVQDISEADAVAEGFEASDGLPLWQGYYQRDDGELLQSQSFADQAPDWMVEPKLSKRRVMVSTAKEQFERAWYSAYPGSWDRNDWVWCITFKKIGSP